MECTNIGDKLDSVARGSRLVDLKEDRKLNETCAIEAYGILNDKFS